MDFSAHKDFLNKMNPIILLERCDKIWNTLQLIKQIQNPSCHAGFEDSLTKANQTNLTFKNRSEIQQCNNAPCIVIEDDHEDKDSGPYNNENDDSDSDECINEIKDKNHNNPIPSPNFTLSVKHQRQIVLCNVCGKLYRTNRSLRSHSLNVHGIFLPPGKRGPKSSKVDRNRTSLINNNDSFIKVNTINKNTHNNLPQENLSFIKFKESESSEKMISDKTQIINQSPTKKVHSFYKSNDCDDTSSTSSLSKNDKRKNSNNSGECILCEQFVTNLKVHFVEYHKINCPLEMLDKFDIPLTKSDKPIAMNNKKTENSNKTASFNSMNAKNQSESFDNSSVEELGESLFDESNLSDDYRSNPKRKNTIYYNESRKKFKTFDDEPSALKEVWKISKSQMIHTERYQCDICYGEYRSSEGLAKHKRIHRSRGETKENFHLFQCRYFKSPMFPRQSLNLQSVHHKNLETISSNMNKRLDNIQGNGIDNSWEFSSRASRLTDERESSFDAETSINLRNEIEKDAETICICGRSFRNPHTLFTHKNNCKLFHSKKNNFRSYNRLDKDLNAGINIRIKRKNDSYEIVSKDSGDENGSKNSEIHYSDVGLYQSFDESYRKTRNLQRRNYKENSSSDEEFLDDPHEIHCDICNKKIHILTKLEHEYYHYRIGFPCHLCKRAYPTKTIFLNHHNIVHGDMPYEKQKFMLNDSSS